jgi:hypothetical protein
MSTQQTEAGEQHQVIENALFGQSKTTQNAQQVYEGLCRGWDMPQAYVGDGIVGTPVSRFADALYQSDQENPIHGDTKTMAERLYGTRHPFLAAMLTGPEYEQGGGVRDVDNVLDHIRDATPDNGRGLVDDGVVKAASPVEVDPMIVDIQRDEAPILSIIPSVAQPGFTAQFNQFISRTLEDWYMTEADAADLSNNTGSEFALNTETKDMKIGATVLNVSDFSQRAEQTLGYMNLMDTTVGQVMKEIFLTKAKTWFYGDPGGGGSGLHENSNAHDGLASFAADAGNVADKTGTSSGYLQDMLEYATAQVLDSGLSFGRASFLVSLEMYNEIYDEQTPVVRIDGYDAPVEYGPRGIAIGHERGTIPVRPCDNIRDYQSSSSGVGSNSTTGDVFLYDEQAVQYRQLAPMSSVPLGRLGLADRAAIFEYGTLIDKSLDTNNSAGHTHRLRYGAV